MVEVLWIVAGWWGAKEWSGVWLWYAWCFGRAGVWWRRIGFGLVVGSLSVVEVHWFVAGWWGAREWLDVWLCCTWCLGRA